MVLHVIASFLFARLHTFCRFLEHDDLEFELSLLLRQLVQLVFQLLELGFVFIDHTFLECLVLLVQLERLLLVQCKGFELGFDFIRDCDDIERVKELVAEEELLVLTGDGALAAPVETAAFGTGAAQILQPTRVHHNLDLILDHRVLDAVEQ